jgi:putative ABC transport system permease protein
MLTQGILAHLASGLFLQVLPAPSLQPLLYAMLAGLIMLLAVLMPEIMRLSQVPAMHVLRRVSLETTTLQRWRFLPALLCFAALILLTAGNLALASYSTFNHQRLGVWRLTMSNLQRRPWLTIAQVAGISLGFTAILLLTLIRGDVLNQWRASLPENAPNRFVINLQPEQLTDVHSYFEHHHLAAPPLLPMVRGRLTALNGQAVYSSQYADEQTQRLVDREFNLSWAEQLQSDNKIVAGQWWSAIEANTPQISIEEGIAEKLHIKLGDTLQYDIAGNTIALKVTSLRKVAWDSMHPNFFVIAPPGVFDHFPVSYIASFHLAADQEPLLSVFVSQFPNATVIDVGAILDQLRNIINRMADAVQAVFVFSILSGLMVLYASLVATLDERQYENALLRTLGAKSSQIRNATLAEFACIGAVASGFAAITATGLVAVMSKRVFDLDYHLNLLLPMFCIVLGASFVALAAWMILRTALLQSPKAWLQTAT